MKLLICCCLVCLPLKNLKINSGYGYRVHPITGKYALHAGVDLKARSDTVYALMNGKVETVSYDSLLGLFVWLSHGRLESIYGHLSQVLIVGQDSVLAGEPIAITGATGRVTGEHLHFAIRYNHQYINPIKFLYELLKKQENEQDFQSTADTAFRQADR